MKFNTQLIHSTGKVGDVEGPIKGVVTNPTYIDVSVPPSSTYRHSVPQDHTVFAYVFDGEGGSFGPVDSKTQVPIHHMAGKPSNKYI